MTVRILKSGTPAFQTFIAALLDRRGSNDASIDAVVARIIADVRRRGDRALIDYTSRFDRVRLALSEIRVGRAELAAARRALDPDDRRALELAAQRIETFHRRTLEWPFNYRDSAGVRLGQIVRPLKRVGVYVPGGFAAYPSSVLMNVVPATRAGTTFISTEDGYAANPPGT